MRRSILAALVAVAAVAVSQQVAQPAARARCGGSLPRLRFASPVIVDAARAGGEPSVAALRDGTLLYAAHAGSTHVYRTNASGLPDYVVPYTGATYMWRSTNGGRTWTYVGLPEAGNRGPHALVTGFSDPDLAVDSAGTVYTSGIDLATVYVARSGDRGATWEGNALATVLTDREWLAADRPGVVYLNGNQLGTGRMLWRSTDGGRSFDQQAGVRLPGGGPPSKMAVDPRDGRLYFPVGPGGRLGEIAVYPNARRGDLATRTVFRMGSRMDARNGFFNPIALDEAGNVYVVDNTAHTIWLHSSTDRGRTWSKSMVYRSDGTVLWPWISAGSDGRVGISWLQADRAAHPPRDPASWRIVAAQTATGHGCGSRPPAWKVAVATPRPIHVGRICISGVACQTSGSDRRLGDYHTNAITPDGDLVIAYATTSPAPGSIVSRPAFVRQSSGIDFTASR